MLDHVSIIMLGLFAVAGAAAVLAFAFSLNLDMKRKTAAGIIMLIIYIMYIIFTAFVYLSFNYDSVVLYVSVIFMVLSGTGYVVYRCVKEKKYMNWLMLLVFLIYCAIVVAVTILIRRGTFSKSINMIPFGRVIKAVSTGQMDSVEHDILNILLFIPFGFLLAHINKQVFRKTVFALIFGLAASSVIETIQLVFHLGECDINDIIANTLGSVVGRRKRTAIMPQVGCRCRCSLRARWWWFQPRPTPTNRKPRLSAPILYLYWQTIWDMATCRAMVQSL